jgi:magnesium chelatase family protein
LRLIQFAMTDLNLRERAYDRILRLAHTVADLAGAASITSEHVSEAIQYRSLDRQIWG